MPFQLWELESRNCIAEFATRSEALAAVREIVAEHGAASVASFLLVSEDADGNVQKVASGRELAALTAAFPVSVDT